MTVREKQAGRLNISYISALILIFTTGLLMISIILLGILDNLLLIALALSTSVVYLQWRTPNISLIEILCIILFDLTYIVEIFVMENLTVLTALIFLSLITAFIALVRRDLVALASITTLAIEGVSYPLHTTDYLAILSLLSLMPLASSKKIHSLLPLTALFPILLISSNALVPILTTLTYILFISSIIETGDKCLFRREVSLVIGGFLIQASIIVLVLLSYEPYRLLSYWVLGYMINAIGLTSPPFYRPPPDNEVVYKTDV
ncbi:MAG: hypothetical protein F7B60_04645 [Desulfurococcales archaeon]|nr:hypothetical protein [Desulfurococcales archaeon]